jgi:hypothetical protein
VADSSSRATRVLDEIEKLLRGGNKIAAIKVYRTATGVGLKEARDTVEAIERAMRQKDGTNALGAIERGRRTTEEPEVDRAKSPSFLGGIFKALTRWRGQAD